MEEIIKGLTVDIRTYETWIHFKSSKGNHCSFCVENKFPDICAKGITGWVQDRLKDQEDKRMGASDKLIREARIDRP